MRAISGGGGGGGEAASVTGNALEHSAGGSHLDLCLSGFVSELVCFQCKHIALPSANVVAANIRKLIICFLPLLLR